MFQFRAKVGHIALITNYLYPVRVGLSTITAVGCVGPYFGLAARVAG